MAFGFISPSRTCAEHHGVEQEGPLTSGFKCGSATLFSLRPERGIGAPRGPCLRGVAIHGPVAVAEHVGHDRRRTVEHELAERPTAGGNEVDADLVGNSSPPPPPVL